MQFRVGDRVVHPVHGVVTVQGLSEQRFAGNTPRNYYKVATAGLTVWVPLDDRGTSVLRRLASKDTLSECRRLLKGRPGALDKDRRVRQMEISDRLKNAELTDLSEIVRDLTALGTRQPLGKSEQELLKRARKALSEEWAIVDGVTAATALDEIDALLQDHQLRRSARDGGDREKDA